MRCHFFRKLYIADARPRKNAIANGAMGGGSESSSHYFQSEVSLCFNNSPLLVIKCKIPYLLIVCSFCIIFF